MNQRQFDFGDRLQMSNGVCASVDVGCILLREIPGALTVSKAHETNDRRGVDWWVEQSGRHLGVDAKVREEDYARRGHDDLALETWSVIPGSGCSGAIGWTRDVDKRCDYILWLWVETGRWCLIPFPFLCAVFSANWKSWRGQYKTSRQRTTRDFRSWESECTFVPRRVVWAEIYRRFSGHLED